MQVVSVYVPSQAYPEYTIEECSDQRMMQSVQNKFDVHTGPRESVSLEWKFFVSCLNSFKHNAIDVRKKKEVRRIKVPRTASGASASLQRGKDFPVATRDMSEKAQCQAKKTGKTEERVANATKGTGKGSKNSASLHTMWRSKAMVPREVRAHCSIVRVAKRREGLGEQSLAETNVFTTNIKFKPCRRTQKGSVLPC